MSPEAMEIKTYCLASVNKNVANHAAACVLNLQNKIKRKVYDNAKAPILWEYHVKLGQKEYNKEFGCNIKLPKSERIHVSKELHEHFQTKLQIN